MRQTIFLIPALIFVACASNAPAQELRRFDDLPIPEGLTYERWSGNVSPSGLRVGTQEHAGKRGVKDVAKFYRDTLPAHGWQLAGDEPGDPAKLSFVKKEEKCDVVVAGTADGVKVTVKLDYKK